MAKVTITVTDLARKGEVNVELAFDPPVKPGQLSTPAIRMVMQMIDSVEESRVTKVKRNKKG